MKALVEHMEARDSFAQFSSIPGSILLGANILQYLQDSGECICEHYQESEEFFLARKGKSRREHGYSMRLKPLTSFSTEQSR